MLEENYLNTNYDLNRIRYREEQGLDMTYILGARCKDGVVLIGDRKITLEGGTDFDFEDKIFKDIHPIVVGSSGVTGLFDMFRNRVSIYVNQYATEHRGQPIIIQPFLDAIADITKEINDRWSPRLLGEQFDVLLSFQLSPTSLLWYIYPFGFPEIVRGSKAIGHGSRYGKIFLKQLWSRDMTMEQTAELGYFIIRCIDKLDLDNSVGGEPQIWFIPDPATGEVGEGEKTKYEVRQADKTLIDKFNGLTEIRITQLKEKLPQIFTVSSVVV